MTKVPIPHDVNALKLYYPLFRTFFTLFVPLFRNRILFDFVFTLASVKWFINNLALYKVQRSFEN